MNLRKFVACSLLLVIGHILHQLAPPLLMGMKPDFLLTMMFIAIMLADDYKLATVVGLSSGLLTAITTTFPGGEIANIVDKLITCQVAYLLFKVLGKNMNGTAKMLIVAVVGTLVSGFSFLTVALYTAGLPAPYGALVRTVVLPTAAISSFMSVIVFRAVSLALRHSRLSL